MPNPTDKYSYQQGVADMAAHQAETPADFGRGVTDGWRLWAEGTPVATVQANGSAPTQSPQPALAYGDWLNTANALRDSYIPGSGYGPGLQLSFRRFGGEYWPLEWMILDLKRLPHPAPPPNPPLFRQGPQRPAPQKQPPLPSLDTTGNPATTLPASQRALPGPADRRFWRGNAWSTAIPGLPWLPGLTSSLHPERCLTWFLGHPLWRDWVDKILTRQCELGLTHFTLSWPDCRQFMSLQAFVSLCQYVKSWGFFVHVKWWSKDYDPANSTWDVFGPIVTPVLEALVAARAIDCASPWEFNSDNVVGAQGQGLIDGVAAVLRPAGVDTWIHFGPECVWWGAPDFLPNRDEYWAYQLAPQARMGGLSPLVGILYQAMPPPPFGGGWSPGLRQARILDSTNHDGFVNTGAAFVMWEGNGALEFDSDYPDEATSAMWGFLGLCTPGKIPVSGFGDGCWLPDGTPTLAAA